MTIKITFDTNCILIDEKDCKKPYYNQIKALENFEIRGFVKILKPMFKIQRFIQTHHNKNLQTQFYED